MKLFRGFALAAAWVRINGAGLTSPDWSLCRGVLAASRRIAGVTPALLALAVVFAIAVSLGGITVFLANSPFSVMLHWGMATALLANVVWRLPLALREAHAANSGATFLARPARGIANA